MAVVISYKGKNVEFPDQKAAEGFVKAVAAQIMVDQTVDPSTAPGPTTPGFEDQVNKGIPAAMVGFGNTSLFGQGPRVVAGIDTALQKAGLQDKPSVIGGGYEQNLASANDSIRQAQEASPLGYGAGSLLAILKGPAKGVGGSVSEPLKQVVAKGAAGGALAGGQGYLGGKPTDEQTVSGVAKAAGIGGLMGGATGTVLKGLDRGAEKAAEAFLKKSSVDPLAENPESFGKWVRSVFGKVTGMGNLKVKNQEYQSVQATRIGDVISKVDDASVPLPKDITVSDVRKLTEHYGKAGAKKEAQQLLFIEREMRDGNGLSASNAQFLKEVLGDQSRNAQALKNTTQAKVFDKWRYAIKEKIIATLEAKDKSLAESYQAANKEYEYSKVLQNQLKKAASSPPPRPDSLGQIGKFLGTSKIYSPKAFSSLQPGSLNTTQQLLNTTLPGFVGSILPETPPLPEEPSKVLGE